MIPGTAAWPCGAGPPESAGVLGAARPRPKGPGVAPAADSKAESPSLALATAAVTPGERRQEKRRTPWPWKIFSLDLESFMRVRPVLLHLAVERQQPAVCVTRLCLELGR